MRQLHATADPVRWGVLVTLALMAALLSACGALLDTELTIYADERYIITMTLTVPSDAIALVGGPAAMASQLDDWVKEAQADGAQAKWRQGKAKQASTSAYVIEVSGQGFRSAAIQDAFLLSWTEYKGRKAVKFEMSPQALSSGLAVGAITLHAGEILSSNGQKIGKDSVRWDNPISGVQAIAIPKGGTNPLLVVGILAGLLFLAAVAFVAYRRSRLRASGGAVTASAPGRSFCPHCGQPTQPGARFCMSCGQPIPPRQG